MSDHENFRERIQETVPPERRKWRERLITMAEEFEPETPTRESQCRYGIAGARVALASATEVGDHLISEFVETAIRVSMLAAFIRSSSADRPRGNPEWN